MTPKVAEFLNLGMRRDVADSKSGNQYVYENHNVRIDTNDGDTVYSATNERGNLYKGITITGTILGLCELIDGVVVFSTGTSVIYNGGGSAVISNNGNINFDPRVPTEQYPGTPATIPDNPQTGQIDIGGSTEMPFPGGGSIGPSFPGLRSTGDTRGVTTGTDKITYIKRTGENYSIEKQYVGNLNFQTGGFFDSIVDYETEDITKVYWVDGVNQPRVITLQEDWSEYDDTSFDFVPEIDKFPHIYIEKQLTSGVGLFKSGIVQYFFTYSNVHGVETAVVYSSPLFYADHKKRAGAPDDFVECQFNISMSNLSEKFDKINIYRAIRTSENTEVEVVKIANIDISGDSTSIIDNYSTGEAVAPTDLFFKGGDRFIAGTLAAKDNTLFLGNINTVIPDYDELTDILDHITTIGFGTGSASKTLEYVQSNAFLDGNREVTYTEGTLNGQTFHSSDSYLKKGDYYHVGIQLQDKYGKWTEPIVIDSYLSPTGIPGTNTIPKQKLSIDRSSLSSDIKEKYKRVRAVVCYPSENQRRFVAQGVLNPTVYCAKDKVNNTPSASSSWFFRPVPPQSEAEVQTETSRFLEYRHDYMLGSNHQLNGELQFMEPYYLYNEGAGTETRFYTMRHVQRQSATVINDMRNSEIFAIDASTCTLHSPDITDVGTDQETLSIDIVGHISTDKVVSEYKIIQSTTSQLQLIDGNNVTPERKYKAISNTQLATWPLYFDSFAYYYQGDADGKMYTEHKGVGWAVYPWQADRPLGNDYVLSDDPTGLWSYMSPERDGTRTDLYGQYSKKVLGNIKYCNTSQYYANPYHINNTSDICFYRKTANSLLKIDSTIGDVYYYAGLDEIFAPTEITDVSVGDASYVLTFSNGTNSIGPGRDAAVSYSDFMRSSIRSMYPDGSPRHIFIDALTYGTPEGQAQGESQDCVSLLAKEPTLVRYKSNPHAIFKINPELNDGSSTVYHERVLPGYLGDYTDNNEFSIWDEDGHLAGVESAVPSYTVPNSTDDVYLIGELTRNTTASAMFPQDINDQAFYPSSDTFDFDGNTVVLELYGDIHYQRWDCLKTYPLSYDDKNQVIDVLSFMVESKLNLAGRYDKYVETEDVTLIDDSFFDLINDVYQQKDNFFTYRVQEDWIRDNNSFPNQFTWSQTKHPGDEIDIWTSVNLASTYQTDGTLGEIRKIIKFGDILFCFQDKGISQIMFNSNIQLSSTSGVPIELANSGKVDGVRYYSNMEGCKNPWTIKPGIRGIYFFDDINHSIDRISGQGFDRLSENKGFSDFAHNNPISKTWFDNEKKDVHFVNSLKTIAFSEKFDEFTSFYDYGVANIGFSVGDHFNHFYGSTNKLYTARKGDYFYFFNGTSPWKFSITYRVAPQPYEYKIFNTVDYLLRVTSQRGINHDLVYDTGFHEIEISTENGTAKQKIDKSDFALNMNQIKKFNIWRTNIPRFDFFRRADGTSLYLSLSAGPDEYGNAYQSNLADKRYELHNLKVAYLS